MKSRVIVNLKRVLVLSVLSILSFCMLCSVGSVGSLKSNFLGSFPSLSDFFRTFFESPFKSSDDIDYGDEYVYLAGFPIGITIESDGVVVIAKGTVTTKTGEESTTIGSDIKVGDIITINYYKKTMEVKVKSITPSVKTDEALEMYEIINDSRNQSSLNTYRTDFHSHRTQTKNT